MAYSLCESFEELLIRQEEICGPGLGVSEKMLARTAFFYGAHCAIEAMLRGDASHETMVGMVREINQEAVESVRRALQILEEASR